MEPMLEFPKELEETKHSLEELEGQNHVLPEGGNVMAVRAQSSDCSKEDPYQQLAFLRETLDRQVLEYEEMAVFLSPEEQRRRLLAFLTIFLKVWEQSGGNICFPNLQLLASETSSLLVKEIKKKMNGKPAEEAQRHVWQFLQQEAELDSDGYLLLRSVYLLSCCRWEQELQWTIIKSGLPLTLLQCLYLFLVSPLEIVPGYPEENQGEWQVQEIFLQTMLNIYSEKQGVEELLTTTDLKSLVLATSSLWNQSRTSWKQATSQVLQTISMTLPQNSVTYLQDCIKASIQNLSECDDSLSTCDICEAVNIILHFVRNSYIISPALLLEFESNGGYQLLLKTLLRYNGPQDQKLNSSLKETVDLLTQLILCGETELNVSGNITYPQLPEFNGEQTPSSGKRIRNLKAFQVLESLFRKSNSPELCQYILLALRSIWTWDSMNFFLLEWSLQPISQFVGIISLKPSLVQIQFFQLVESVVVDLCYIPHEILKGIQNLIKENAEPLCTSAAWRCLHCIAQRDPLFTDIFRDSGLLGMLLVQLRKEAKLLIKNGNTQAAPQVPGEELLKMMLKMAATLVVGSVRNTVILRDYGMVPYIKIYVYPELYRSDALTILEQLSVINSEEYMSIIIGALCSSTQEELHFKMDLLKSLLKTLANPKGRLAFRSSSGFYGLFSLLADMQGALQDPPLGLWALFSHSQILELILQILQTIAAALYLDPANSDFFQKSGFFEKMAEDLGMLGCFSALKWGQIPTEINKPRSFDEFLNAGVGSDEIFPTWLKSCMRIIAFLDHMAKMNPFDFKCCLVETKQSVDYLPLGVQEGKANKQEECQDNKADTSQFLEFQNRSCNESLVIVCPGALCVMVKLICKLHNEAYPKLSWEIQYAVADHIQSLMSLEKSRQVACTAGLLNAIITSCPDVLHNTNSPLHLPLIKLFEKVASQSIELDTLRQFLCLRMVSFPAAPGHNMSPSPSDREDLEQIQPETIEMMKGCVAALWNDSAKDPQIFLNSDASWISRSSAMALQTATSLISLTTPRSLHLQSSCLTPSFVEFDMSFEGYGCLFIPSLATILGRSTECSVLGGMGKGTRQFPPLDGLTFSSWFLISKMGSVHDGHPVRLLTLVRHMARMEDAFVCFAVRFSPTEGCLTISTEEVVFEALDTMLPECEDESSLLTQVQFRCAELLVSGQWHHLAVSVAKETKQICTVSAYVNGLMVGSAKMQYIQPLPGNFVSMDTSSFVDVFGYVATPPVWKKKSSLNWRQGPMYLFEEVLSMKTLQFIEKLGPRYCRNFQAVDLRDASSCNCMQTTALVSQEKISFGINVRSSTYVSVQEIKDCFSEVDGRLIAKELSLSSRDRTTPVFMAQNTAGKLLGPSRTIGAVAMGQYGTRIFQSCPAVVSLNYLGGPSLLLVLLDMAQDDRAVYAAVKVMHTVLNSSTMSETLMRQVEGYQILAYLLKKKIHLLNSRILHLLICIGNTAEEYLTIRNLEVVQHVICNFELWCHASENLDLSLFRHLTEMLQSSREDCSTGSLIQQVQMVPKLFHLFGDPGIACSRISRICNLLFHLLRGHFNIKDFLWTGLFLVYTLPPASVDENLTCFDCASESLGEGLIQTSGKTIWLRNQLLSVLLDVTQSDKHHVSSEIQEEMFQAFGPDWFLMFMQGHVHKSTFVLAARLLIHFLHNRTFLHTFKEGKMAGLWLRNSLEGLNILMDNLRCSPQSFEHIPYQLSGLAELKMLLSNCLHIPEIYVLLSGLLLSTPVSKLPDEANVGLNAMLEWLLSNHRTETVVKVGLCPEAAVLLLEMVTSLLRQVPGDADDSWETTFVKHILHFICLVYHRYSQDLLWLNSSFLQALALALFPSVGIQDGSKSGLSPHGIAFSWEQNASPCDSLLLHPARKPVWDLIQLLLTKMLLLDLADKKWHPLDFILEVSAENATSELKGCFQTEVLLFIIDIINNLRQDYRDISSLSGNRDIRNVSESDRPLFLVNVCYFTQKLVNKLYEGMFFAEPRKTILFITKQLQLVTGEAFLHKETIISTLYNCLNQTVLYYISNPHSDWQSLLDVLRTLQTQWDSVFAAQGSSMDFITCFLYCLLQLRSISFGDPDGTMWMPASHHPIFLGPRKEEERMDDLSALKDVQQDIRKTVEEIWLHLLSQKRKNLEDTYKISLFIEKGDGNDTMKISDVNPVWKEMMENSWHRFLDKKNSQNRIPIQVANKMRSLKSSLFEAIKMIPSRNLNQDFASYLEKCRRTAQELYAVLCRDHAERLQCAYNKSAKAWTDLEEQLFRKGAPWELASTPISLRWTLDGYEGPTRMRKRIRFNVTYHTVESSQNKAQQTPNTAATVGNQDEPLLSREGGPNCDQLTFFPSLHEHFQSEEVLEMCMERKIILQELVQDEKITCQQSVVVVDGCTASEGVLLFGQDYFYVCKHYTLSHLKEVYCTSHCLSCINESFIYSLCHKTQTNGQPSCSRHSYSDIKEIQPMRFLLQEIALEIFFKNGYSIFLVFHNKDRTKTLTRFCSVKSKGIKSESTNIRRNPGKGKSMLLKWQRREISNFEYLMYLNTLAGRTYSDLMQYPVFPWVLADYHSQTLDLTNPNTFRDLSKPMGAQSEERKEKFTQRFKETEKTEGNLSAQSHYYTHYSSAMIVASYLVRLDPFTDIFRSLQGGEFDVADRMFHSMEKTWESASRDNMTDVRELIPEFFYLPEFLLNHNHIDFGCLQDGTLLNDVQLPPWAGGNPHKFIRLHREALESDYVSNHLHHWIDLIFGSKQQGSAAVKAVNVFHPYFYGDQVHLDIISDPLIKNTILGFVSNFGQIPKQLFTKPHPQRNALNLRKHPMGRENILFPSPTLTLSNLHHLKLSSMPVKEAPQGPIGYIVCTEKDILAVEKKSILLPPLWNKIFSWGSSDFTCCLADFGSNKKMTILEAPADWGTCLCAVSPTPTSLITSGNSCVVCVWEFSRTRDGATTLLLKKPLFGHTQPVTCLAASMAYSIIVSGSADRSCILWDLNQLTYLTRLPAHEGPLSAVAINDSTGEIASCAGIILYLWNINGQLLAKGNATFRPGGRFSCCCFFQVMDWDAQSLIVTGDTDGRVQVWKLENASPPCYSKSRSEEGNSCKDQTNQAGGKVEEAFVLHRSLELLGMISSDGRSKINPAITALAVSRNYSKLLAGNEEGKIFCWSIDD